MVKRVTRKALLRWWVLSRKRLQLVEQFSSYYQRMLGDIYYWRPTEKALLISLTALLINFVAECVAVGAYVFDLSALNMSIHNVGWAVTVFAFNLLLLGSSCVASWLLRNHDQLQIPLLVFALFSLVLTMALLMGTIGFFDGVTWQIFFLFNAALIVFLDRIWVFISFICLLALMIVMSFSEDTLPFPVRAIRLAPQLSLSDIGFFQRIFEWFMLLLVGGFGITVVDFFLSAWRNRDRDLRSLSFIDELTQLMNRRAVFDGLQEEYYRALRVGYPISVALIDLDHFKSINDRFGHPFGDEVLKGIAKEFASIGRKNDLVGRYGGEEFIIVFPECNAKVATALMERLRIKVEQLEFKTDQGESVFVTMSAGVAQQEEADEEYLQLVARADFALYRAKEFGRNRVLSIEIEDNEPLAFLDRI